MKGFIYAYSCTDQSILNDLLMNLWSLIYKIVVAWDFNFLWSSCNKQLYIIGNNKIKPDDLNINNLCIIYIYIYILLQYLPIIINIIYIYALTVPQIMGLL